MNSYQVMNVSEDDIYLNKLPIFYCFQSFYPFSNLFKDVFNLFYEKKLEQIKG